MSAPVALWPAGFKERKQAHADALVARDSAPSPLDAISAMFPGALELAVKALGLAHVPDWVLVAGRDALAACIASVTVQTAGTVTVIDRRTKPRCPDCDDSGLTDHDPAMTPCASCRPA